MKKLIVLISLLVFVNMAYSSEIANRDFSNSKEITKLLSTTIPTLKNPYCISRFVRTDEILPLYLSTGHFISSVATKDETIQLENSSLQGIRVSLTLKSPEGDTVKGPSIFCQLK